jgi:hypothetical protein
VARDHGVRLGRASLQLVRWRRVLIRPERKAGAA